MSPVRRVLIVRGHPGVLRDHAEQARIFYGMLFDLFQNAGLEVVQCDADPAGECLPGAQVLVGHSLGTRSVCASYDPTRHKDVRGIVLFDPSDLDWEIWQRLTVRRRAFISRGGGQWWCSRSWSHSTYLPDGHYFLNSFTVISKELKDIRDW